jgi:UDP-galactopyranose mutase
MTYDYVVVGAGFFGSVIAERIAHELGCKVLVIDKRPHIGGNCYSRCDESTGIEYHQYGTHIFHTSSPKAWKHINKFTEFNGYHHQVLTTHRRRVYQMPINLETINSFYKLSLTPHQARDFIAQEIAREYYPEPANLEEVAVSSIGRPLYEAFIKGYTMKQWNKDPKELPASIISRLPIRYNYCEDYFVNSRWQGIPLEGYTKIFERMLSSRNIHVELNCDYFENRDSFRVNKEIIYTGPVDRFFHYAHGHLEWRSLEFEKKVFEIEDFQGTSVMNYADVDIPYTRTHEYRHLHPERTYTKDSTMVFYETPVKNDDEPYYPVNTVRNEEMLSKYRQLADEEKDIIFGGRLGDYKYYDMDKTILAALQCFEEKIAKKNPSLSKI